ncbi:DUF1015 domain-containing protein [Marinigracilibium pacificum]|uniref:DUF1015 domain-containing protein n=1 Tax=Marinigracilibium pacificum TaxID=2729599 RepID=A0A848IUQ3_9BACT|nr:DUF1015 domain-containing protein [Marinigracilibium pacificum]NMM48067.1 DUF1015 domain-containing protein [Marinigracilibium pacificum]
MADILPIRAWRYNESKFNDLEELTAPLFDVVSNTQREQLYKNPFNSIHLSVPLGPDPIANAQKKLEEWKNNEIIKLDTIPGIYVYYQYFKLHGEKKEYVRKGFICNIRVHDWDDKEKINSNDAILRHENTIPNAVNDRIELLQATQIQASPTHGLYSDKEHQLENLMDEAIKHPIAITEDYQGVKDVLGVIHDYELIKKFIKVIKDRSIILADGHHRYEGALSYFKKMKSDNPNHTGNEPYNFHMMYLTNIESDDLRILPTHRLINGIENFDIDEILKRTAEWFTIKPVDNPFDIGEVILGKPWAFGLVFKDQTYKIRLKPEMIDQISWNFPDIIKKLDLTVLHYYFIEKVLGIPGRDQRKSSEISFERNFTSCINSVVTEKSQCALITQELSVEDVKNVCYSGYTLPQKSTYFYPKTISGFLFGSLKEDEFYTTPHISF